MWSYRKKVERDLSRWCAAGWVTSEGAAAIRADVAKARHGPGLASALAILAAVLLGFAVMSFVAANWSDMSRLVRLLMLVGTVLCSYAGAAALILRGLDSFGHAAVLLGASAFGASIMLISQMYHMDGNPPDAVLAWGAGALLAGLGLRSNPALALAMALVALWGGWETTQRWEVYWPFLLGWAAVSAAFYWHRWRPGTHLSGLALTAFVVSLGGLLGDGHQFGLVAGIGLVAAALALIGERTFPDLSGLWPAALSYAIVITFAGLYTLQFFETRSLDSFVLLAVLTLILMIAAIYWGLVSGNRGALWLGYVGFSLEILGIYAKTLGTLMSTSLFFLIAGLIVAALAAAAYKLHARNDLKEALT